MASPAVAAGKPLLYAGRDGVVPPDPPRFSPHQSTMPYLTRFALIVSIACAVSVAAEAQCVAPGLENFETATASTTASCGTMDPGVLPSGWTNDPAGTTVWRVRSGPTPSGGTGPAGDHTTGSGNYVYVETSCSSSAFWHGTLFTPCYDASTLQNPTLSFWTHMFGSAMGTLSVQQLNAQGGWSTIYTIAGDQGMEWQLHLVPLVPVGGQIQVRFFYVRGTSFTSDCCLDDIAIGEPTTGGNCIAPGFEDFENAVQPTNSPCATNVGGTLPPGWANAGGNDIDWRAWSGSTPSGGTGPSANHSHNGSATGKYVYVEVSGCALGDVATLNTPCWDASSVTTPSIEFWYHLYGAAAGRLDLQELRPGGQWVTVWSVAGDQGNQWRQGAALMSPWGGVVRARFRYERGSSFQSDCAIDDVLFGEPTPGDWQINQAGASFDVDGATGHTLYPAAIARCPLFPIDLNFDSTLVGSPWDLGVASVPSAPASAGGAITAGGQRINVDLTHPSLAWFNGGGVPSLTTPFPGTHTLPALTPPSPVQLSAQMFVVDATHADGIVLSQGMQVDVVAAIGVPGPALDEDVVSVSPYGLPLCGPAAIPFFGTAHDSVNVHSNGRVTFGYGPAVDFSSSPAEAMAGLPFVGFWTDLDPSQGTVTVSAPTSSRLRVDWNGVPYFGETQPISFSIEFNAASGAVELLGLTGVATNPQGVGLATAGDRQFLGISPGLAGGATDPGPVIFTVGGFGSGGATEMLYDWYDHVGGGTALVPSILGGLDRVRFAPNGSGGYDWTGF